MPTLPLRALPSTSRREGVAGVLREAITSGELPPGYKLVELDIAHQLGTSRAPVREALRQLEQEGLIVSYPYRGTAVLGVSQEEIENVLVPVRIALEQFAFRKAMDRMGDDDFTVLEGIVESMESAAARGDLGEIADDDVRFHEAVVIFSGQQHCLQIWRSIQPRVRAYFRRDASYYGNPSDVAGQHRELIDVLRSGDAGAAEKAVVTHIRTHFSEPPAGA